MTPPQDDYQAYVAAQRLTSAIGVTAGQYVAAVNALPPAARALLGMTDAALLARVEELAAFAGDGAYLEGRLPEVLGNPQVATLLTEIAGRLTGPHRPKLVAMINDLLLGASLLPAREAPAPRRGGARGVRRTIDTMSPDRLVAVLDAIAWRARQPQDPQEEPWEIALLAEVGYRPGQPLGERLTRLALLNLSQAGRDRVWEIDLFGELMGGDQRVLAEFRYAASGPEAAVFFNTSAAASTSQQLRERVPTILGQLAMGYPLLDHVEQEIRLAGRDVLDTYAAQSRVLRADRVFAGIEVTVRALLASPGDLQHVRAVLEQQTALLGRQMQKLYGICDLTSASHIPVLTRRWLPGHRYASYVVGGLRELVSWPFRALSPVTFAHRYRRVPAQAYRNVFGGLFVPPLSTPQTALAQLGPDPATARERWWKDVRHMGGIQAVSTAHDLFSGRVRVYLRAVELADGTQALLMSDPRDGSEKIKPLAKFTARFTGGWKVEARTAPALRHDQPDGGGDLWPAHPPRSDMRDDAGTRQITELLALIGSKLGPGHLGEASQGLLRSLIPDLLAATSLVPARQAEVSRDDPPGPPRRQPIETITLARLAGELEVILANLTPNQDPLAPGQPLAELGYHPGQPLAEALTRLAQLINLQLAEAGDAASHDAPGRPPAPAPDDRGELLRDLGTGLGLRRRLWRGLRHGSIWARTQDRPGSPAQLLLLGAALRPGGRPVFTLTDPSDDSSRYIPWHQLSSDYELFTRFPLSPASGFRPAEVDPGLAGIEADDQLTPQRLQRAADVLHYRLRLADRHRAVRVMPASHRNDASNWLVAFQQAWDDQLFGQEDPTLEASQSVMRADGGASGWLGRLAAVVYRPRPGRPAGPRAGAASRGDSGWGRGRRCRRASRFGGQHRHGRRTVGRNVRPGGPAGV